MSGARIVLECLKREGVDVLFGLPGGAVLPIYDALYDFQGIRHILVRQEAAAGHAAEGYARTTGKVGACLVTSGPAATNLVTALQDAYMDSIPIVAFTGQVPTHLIGNDAFQEADNVGITRSCTKHNFLVKDGKDLGPIIREAFHIASTGRPGPVHVDLPKDVLVKEWELVWPEKIQLRSYNPTYDGHPGQIKRAAKLLVRARKPVLYVGGGVISSNASAELYELAELTQIPVTQTLMGLGAFPMEHPLSLDMLGMHGSYYANMAVHHSDVLVAVGARFDDRVTGRVDAFAPHAEIVHIDIEEHPGARPDRRRLPARAPGSHRGGARRAARRRTAGGAGGTQAVARRDRRVEGPAPAPLRVGRRADQAPVRDAGDLEPHSWGGDGRHGRRPAPDVGGTILQVQAPAAVVHLWRAGHDGLRPAHGDGGRRRPPGPARGERRRRRLVRDEQPGAGDLPRQQPRREDDHHQQRRSRHGPAVAGHHLQGPVLRHRLRAEPRLREAGRGVRLRRDPRDQALRGGARAREGVLHAGAGGRGRLGGQVGVRVPDGPGRRGRSE